MSNTDPMQVTLATAADEAYAAPLAVTVRSAIDTLSADRTLAVYVLDGGLSDETKVALEHSWRDPRVSVEWLEPDVGAVEHLPVSDHVSATCYVRLMLPELLPAGVGKVIYLDSDTLVLRDLADLYDEPLGPDLALAVQDQSAPWIDADVADARAAARRRYQAAARPIVNYEQLGLRPDAPYLNSGLLVLDADRWRREDVGGRAFDCLEANTEHVLWFDQYALNVVLAGQWRALDARWNQSAGVYAYPTWRESPLAKQEFDRLLRDPWVVHFCSPAKPWCYFCDHPLRNQFFETLDRTEWAGWRPEAPADAVTLRLDFYRRRIRRAWRGVRVSALNRLRGAA